MFVRLALFTVVVVAVVLLRLASLSESSRAASLTADGGAAPSLRFVLPTLRVISTKR